MVGELRCRSVRILRLEEAAAKGVELDACIQLGAARCAPLHLAKGIEDAALDASVGSHRSRSLPLGLSLPSRVLASAS